MNVQKISVFNQLTKRVFTNKKNIVPLVTIPLIAYVSQQELKTQELQNFFFRKGLKWPDYVKPHPNTGEGICYQDKTKVKKALDDALKHNKITQDEYDTYSKKIAFTGKEELSYDGGEDYSSEVEDFKQSLPFDTDLSPDLGNVLKAPSFSSARGLMKTVLGEDLANKLEADLDDSLDSASHIKQMTLELLGFGE